MRLIPVMRLAGMTVALAAACCTAIQTWAQTLPPIHAAASKHFSLLRGTQTIGSEVWSPTAADTWQIDLQTDKGPVLRATVRFDRKQIPISINCVGQDSEHNTLLDRFSITNGHAQWQNTIEKGSRRLMGPAVYMTFPVVQQQISGFPSELGWLARALLADSQHKLELLPAGEASIERIQQIEVKQGEKQHTLTEYLIHGLDFSPAPVWLDESGDLFAITGVEWVAVIRHGWESSLPALRNAQQAADDDRAAALAQRLAHHPRVPVAFRHVDVFDSERGVIRHNMTVIVSSKRIQAVTPDRAAALPSRTEVIEGRGMTLLPGLWDMHTHLNGSDGLMHLAAGVTTVRDLGNYARKALEMRRDFEQGTRIGPRVWLAGLIDGNGPYPSEAEVLVGTEQEALDAVEWFHRLGYIQMKIYGQIKPEWVGPIAKRAHEFGMRVSGHVPAYMTAAEAVEAGFDEINHTNYLFLNFMPDVRETQTPARYMAPAERAPSLDLGSPAVASFVDFLTRHGTVIDPTLNTYETRYTARKGNVDPALAAAFDHLPFRWKRIALMGGVPTPPEKDQLYRQSFQAFLNMIKMLFHAGVPMVIGSDGIPGLGFEREMELDVQAGIPPANVLQNATLNAARLLHQETDLALVAPGKLADLVLVEGNPVANISNMRRVRTVVRGGVFYSAAELNTAAGMASAK